MEELILD